MIYFIPVYRNTMWYLLVECKQYNFNLILICRQFGKVVSAVEIEAGIS